MNPRIKLCALFVPLALVWAPSVVAQTDAPPAPAESAPAMPPPYTPPPVADVPPPMAPPPPPSSSAPTTIVPAVQSPFRLETPGGSSIKLGLLLQPQYQALGSTALDGTSSNLFIRRTRILVGGTLFGVIEYFVDTDFPNLFLANNVAGAMGAPDTSVKSTPGMNIQDAFVTVKAMGDHLKIDAGYMLPPMSHNAVQGATTLYGWDYMDFTFQHSAGANVNAFNSSANPVGRDVGVELRGLVLDGHLEYRAGLFQGLRDGQTATEVGARNFFRVTGRLQVNLLDAEPGFFYAGTYLGAKKILSFGGSYDFQDSYRYFAVDGFLDLPLGPGLVTAQVNLDHWNGSTFIPTLLRETALMGEAGYLIAAAELSPIVRVEQLWGSGALADQTRVGGGLAYWPYGHNSNLKAFYMHISEEGAPHGANQFNLQWQVYFF